MDGSVEPVGVETQIDLPSYEAPRLTVLSASLTETGSFNSPNAEIDVYTSPVAPS